MFNNMIAQMVSHMPENLVWLFSKRYIAGKKLSDAVGLTQKLNETKIETTIDILGENIRLKEEVLDYRQKYLETIESIKVNGLKASLSVKPSMFGLFIDEDFCFQQLNEVIEKASNSGLLVCLDMEDSSCTDKEIAMFERLYRAYPSTITLVLQAYLKRTINDIKKLSKINLPEHPINIRLCKGIYIEPAELAYQSKKEINQNYVACLKLLMENNFFCAIATHDKKLITKAVELIRTSNFSAGMYEFQMLYGVRPDLRKKIVDYGHPMRVYIPYGTYWFAYSTRRLKENPKMVWHIIKALIFRG